MLEDDYDFPDDPSELLAQAHADEFDALAGMDDDQPPATIDRTAALEEKLDRLLAAQETMRAEMSDLRSGMAAVIDGVLDAHASNMDTLVTLRDALGDEHKAIQDDVGCLRVNSDFVAKHLKKLDANLERFCLTFAEDIQRHEAEKAKATATTPTTSSFLDDDD